MPVIVPTHFVFDGDRTIRLHLARPNPAWDALAERPRAVMSVVGAYTYVPTDWNASEGGPVEYGVPTSYYAAVQATCDATVIDDPEAIAAILRTQLAHFQPQGGHARPAAGDDPYGRQLSGIRGIELRIVDVRAKFKFGGNKSVAHREAIADRLRSRGTPLDLEAREHLLRRLEREG